MKLIVGLGNPGDKYETTRHNVGFLILDKFCIEHNIVLTKTKFNGFYEKVNLFGEDVIIAKPSTYMNLSGDFIEKLSNFYKIKTQDILVIHDDKDIQLGQYKFQIKGSSAGQNGVENIINRLTTENFCRLRVGINSQTRLKTVDFVLEKFKSEEISVIYDLIPQLISGINSFISKDILKTMNLFN